MHINKIHTEMAPTTGSTCTTSIVPQPNNYALHTKQQKKQHNISSCTCTQTKNDGVEQDASTTIETIGQNNINTKLHDLLAFGLHTGQHKPTQIQLELDNYMQQLYTAQLQLGWTQLYYGWYAPQWPIICNQMHPNINIF